MRTKANSKGVFNMRLSQREMFEESFKRPANFFKLSPNKQWDIDSQLGILDWDGGNLSPEDLDRFRNHYD